MAGNARLKFVMTECSKTQIRLAGLIFCVLCRAMQTAYVPFVFIICVNVYRAHSAGFASDAASHCPD